MNQSEKAMLLEIHSLIDSVPNIKNNGAFLRELRNDTPYQTYRDRIDRILQGGEKL